MTKGIQQLRLGSWNRFKELYVTFFRYLENSYVMVSSWYNIGNISFVIVKHLKLADVIVWLLKRYLLTLTVLG